MEPSPLPEAPVVGATNTGVVLLAGETPAVHELLATQQTGDSPGAATRGGSSSPTPRRRGPDRVPRRPKGVDGAELSVAGMAAQGISVRRIGRAMTLSEATVKEILARPHVQTWVAECREATRHLLVDRVLAVAADTADPKESVCK